MDDKQALRAELNRLLDFFTEPGGTRYLKDLENDILSLIDAYTEQRVAEAYKKGFIDGGLENAQGAKK